MWPDSYQMSDSSINHIKFHCHKNEDLITANVFKGNIPILTSSNILKICDCYKAMTSTTILKKFGIKINSGVLECCILNVNLEIPDAKLNIKV